MRGGRATLARTPLRSTAAWPASPSAHRDERVTLRSRRLPPLPACASLARGTFCDFRAESLLCGLSGDSKRLSDLGPAHAFDPAVLDCKGREALDFARTDGKRSERDERFIRVRKEEARLVAVSARVALVPRHRPDCTPRRQSCPPWRAQEVLTTLSTLPTAQDCLTRLPRSVYRSVERGWVKVKNPGYWRRGAELEAMQRSFERRRRVDLHGQLRERARHASSRATLNQHARTRGGTTKAP